MAVFVFYHDRCIDGFVAAWVFHRYMRDAHLIPLNYGDWGKVSAPLESKDEVIFVDVSIPPADVNALAERVEKVTVLDHHKTALDAYAGASLRPNVDAMFDMERSGARMAWDYLVLRLKLESPLGEVLVNYAQDRDLWHHTLPHTHAISAVTSATPFEFDAFTNLALDLELGSSFAATLRAGEMLVGAKLKVVDEVAARASSLLLGSYTVLAVNYGSREGISEIGHALAKKGPQGVGAVWSVNGSFVEVSLRGNGEVDVSAIAKAYGGGGHHDAAGFRVPTLEFLRAYGQAGSTLFGMP